MGQVRVGWSILLLPTVSRKSDSMKSCPTTTSSPTRPHQGLDQSIKTELVAALAPHQHLPDRSIEESLVIIPIRIQTLADTSRPGFSRTARGPRTGKNLLLVTSARRQKQNLKTRPKQRERGVSGQRQVEVICILRKAPRTKGRPNRQITPIEDRLRPTHGIAGVFRRNCLCQMA